MENAIDNKAEIAALYDNIGVLYLKQKKHDQAKSYSLKAINISTQIGDLVGVMEVNKNLSEICNATGDHKTALEYYKQYVITKDSVFNTEKNKQFTRNEMNYEFEKKEAATKAGQEKKDAVTAAEKKKQQTVLLLVSCVLILVFIFAGFIFRSLSITRKQKSLIELKNKETEEQKKIIEEKNKDILDSIRYAKRIQQSLLPTEKYFERKFKQLNKQS
jgi:tetratricopeptide (TPR) repeat protein